MLKYICKRLLLMIPTLLGIIFIVFTVMNLTPGSPGRTILGTAATQEQVDQLNHELGYDRPFLVRFFDYCGDLLQGDMGTSYRTRADFTTALKGRMPTTLKLVRAYNDVDPHAARSGAAAQVQQQVARVLATVEEAFGNLLDTLIGHEAVDVSAEISALETVLAQDGLSGGGLHAGTRQ